MTIRHLEIFVQVYREKSITRAAEKLYMTQPAVPEHITLAQVLEYPLLVREEGSAGRRCLEQVLARRGLQADRRWESIDTQALLQAVAQGLGVAFLPRELAEGVPGVVIRTLADENFCRENVLVWHRHKRLSAELLELMELLEK